MIKLIRKTLWLAFLIFLAITAIFWTLRLAPGDPVERILGAEAKMEEIIKYREQLGLHLPLYKQYFNYLADVIFRFDFGSSLYKRATVTSLIAKFYGPSLILALMSVSISTFVGVFLGLLSAIKKSSIIDFGLRFTSLLGLSFPIFSLAPILVLFFSIKLGLFPVSEWGSIENMFLPILTLVIPLSAIIMRVTRNRYLEDKSEPWVNVLRAKGLSEAAIHLRVLKVTLPTVLNVVAIQLSIVMAGTIITETIFDIPGMGLLLFDAIQNRDYPLVQGIIVYVSIIYMVVYFIVDVVNEKIDPRLASDE